MKNKLFILLMLLSLSARAENDTRQYCGLPQYGYLFKDDLFTEAGGKGRKFPRPAGSQWERVGLGYNGAHIYLLRCNLPLDDYIPLIAFAAGCLIFYKRQLIF